MKRKGQSGKDGVGKAGTSRGCTESTRTAILDGLIIQLPTPESVAEVVMFAN